MSHHVIRDNFQAPSSKQSHNKKVHSHSSVTSSIVGLSWLMLLCIYQKGRHSPHLMNWLGCPNIPVSLPTKNEVVVSRVHFGTIWYTTTIWQLWQYLSSCKTTNCTPRNWTRKRWWQNRRRRDELSTYRGRTEWDGELVKRLFSCSEVKQAQRRVLISLATIHTGHKTN